MDEVTRIEKIDALADRWLKSGDPRPATKVWDAAEVVVDKLAARFAADTAATQNMVAAMERDGLL